MGNKRFPTCKKSIDGLRCRLAPSRDGFEGGKVFCGVERGDERAQQRHLLSPAFKEDEAESMRLLDVFKRAAADAGL